MLALLSRIENIGRKLPHPTLAFAALCLIIIIASFVFTLLGTSATHPISKDIIEAKSLVSEAGFLYMLTNTVSNFMNFAPLGPVLVAMIGIGLADHSGYLPAIIKAFTEKAPKAFLSYALVFIGVLSNLAADAGYIVLIPLAALIYKSFGRHPLAGIAAAFAGVSGGYSANLVIGPVDIVLSGLTVEAAQIIKPDFELNPSSNYWFLLASTFLITIIGGLITDYIVEPYLKKTGAQIDEPDENHSKPAYLSSAFRISSIIGLIYTIAVIAGFQTNVIPMQEGMKGLVVLIALGFAFMGLVYGSMTIKKPNKEETHWTVVSMEKTFSSMSGYLVLMFFAAQFVAYFNWTELGLIGAIQGAELLTQWKLSPTLLLVIIVLFSSLVNLMIGSASAKWALMAPILVPMLMLLNIDPAYSQLAYRVGDSSTNIITPLMPYFALILAYAQQHSKSSHLGTILAMMIPYSFAFLLSWIILLVIWLTAGWPIGF